MPQDIASKMECNKGISAISHDAGRSSARSAAERARRAVAVRTAAAAAAGERACALLQPAGDGGEPFLVSPFDVPAPPIYFF